MQIRMNSQGVTVRQPANTEGLFPWLIRRVIKCAQSLPARSAQSEKQLAIVESLPLGGRRQLQLVRCGAHHYLLGCSADAVTSIVAVAPPTQDETCV